MTETNDRRVKHRSADETCIRAFVSSSDRIYTLVEELGIAFRQKAPDHNVRILRVSRGTHPNSIHVVKMLIRVWDTLALDKDWKDRIRIEIIDVSDTELIRISQIRKEHMNAKDAVTTTSSCRSMIS
jgi:hypothetical protein